MTGVLLDTNALMLPVECDVRVFEELERVLEDPKPVVPAACVAELETLAEGQGEAAVDCVATSDRDLRDRLLARDVPVIGLRGRNELALTRP